MAHDICTRDGKAHMMYVGAVPWHGLGQKLDRPATSAEAIKAAHLDWPVMKVPLYAAGFGHRVKVPGSYALVRGDIWRAEEPDCPVFGIVGEAYTPVQNREAFEFFDSIVGQNEAAYHTAGALGDGERVWILAKLPKNMIIHGDDEIQKFLLPVPNSGFVAIAAGVWHGLGLKQDGSIVCWGDNTYRQCTVPSPNTGFVAIAAAYHSLGLKSDGSIVAWGYNNNGECRVPPPNTGFVEVAAATNHSAARRGDGTPVLWGSDDFGQCDLPVDNEGFVAIVASGLHTVGLQAFHGDLNCDGTITFSDINPFLLALTNPTGYAAQYPRCHILNADIDGNGLVDFNDINPLVALLSQ